MMIQSTLLWSPKEEEKDYFLFDAYESTHQGTRIISRPLESTNENDNAFGNLSGRGAIALYMAVAVIREPFRLIKHIILLVADIAKTILATLNFIFAAPERRRLYTDRIIKTFYMAVELVLRPFAFVLDLLKYIGGVFIHPALAIGYKTP